VLEIADIQAQPTPVATNTTEIQTAVPEPAAEIQTSQTNPSVMLWLLAGVVVFFLVVTLLDRLKTGRNKAGAAEKPVQAPPVPPIPPVVPMAPDDTDDGELVAVITAAIAAIFAQEREAPVQDAQPDAPGGFRVRSIRRTGRPLPAWNRAGREEQIYSRL
jgi:hypothetical protein